MSNDLKHFGVLGMRWGHRKSDVPGVSRSTNNMARRDAKRHADAKMFYGETAGTKRKLLKAEIDRKKKNIPDYEKAFNVHLASVDMAKSAKKAVNDRVRIDTLDKGRKFLKKALDITGPISVTVASALYLRNKDKVDAFVISQGKRIISTISKAVKR